MTICRQCVKRESVAGHRRCEACLSAPLPVMQPRTAKTYLCACGAPRNRRANYCKPCLLQLRSSIAKSGRRASNYEETCSCGNDACTGLTCDRAAPYHPAVTHILVVRPASPRTPYR